MKQKLTWAALAGLFILSLAPAFTLAYNEAQNCSGGVCGILINDLPDGASRLPENTDVILTFGAFVAGDMNNVNICSKFSGTSVYYFLKHYSGANYDFPQGGSGPSFTFGFNSLKAGNQNKYVGFFYCDIGPTTTKDTATIFNKLSDLGSQGKMWSTPTFDLTTTPGPTVVFSSARQAGQDLNISAQNVPSSYAAMEVNINGNKATYNVLSKSFTISAANGFSLTGNNTINVTLLDDQGKKIGFGSTGFKVSQAANTTMYGCAAANGIYACAETKNDPKISACPAPIGEVTPGDMCGCTKADYDAGKCKNGQPVTPGPGGPGMQNNSADKLYNPLPEEDLVHAFLLVAEGFLAILGILAVTFIIIGGFQLVISSGNEEMLVKAKKTIIWAVLGLLIAWLSFSIVAIVQEILKVNIKPASSATSSANIRPLNKV